MKVIWKEFLLFDVSFPTFDVQKIQINWLVTRNFLQYKPENRFLLRNRDLQNADGFEVLCNKRWGGEETGAGRVGQSSLLAALCVSGLLTSVRE